MYRRARKFPFREVMVGNKAEKEADKAGKVSEVAWSLGIPAA